MNWENKTFFYPDSTISAAEVEQNLQSYFNANPEKNNLKNEWLTIREARKLIDQYSKFPGAIFKQTPQHTFDETFWKDTLQLDNFIAERPITRKELAVLFVHYTASFADCRINFYGKNY